MELTQAALVGTLESSDLQITLEPGDGNISLDLESTVINQYGRQIKQVALDTLAQHQVTSAKLSIVDKGALDCTIRARLECAIYRAAGHTDPIPWGGTQ